MLRSLPAWEARLDAADTIPRKERASREYVFDPARVRDLDVPTLYLQGATDLFTAQVLSFLEAPVRAR